MATLPDPDASHGVRVHFTGIGGVGMAGLARLLMHRGHQVSGSEREPNELTDWLAGLGAEIHAGHDAAHLGAADWLVRTPAVADDNPELVAARSAGLPVYRRGEVLADLSTDAIAVSGTHGKTTTATMIAFLLRRLGVSCGWCIGGTSRVLGAVAEPAPDGGVLVVEADESDGTLALYRPAIGVITNLEFDHMEHFAGEQDFVDCFLEFQRGCGCCIRNADDPVLRALEGPAFGFDQGDLRARDIRLLPDGSRCRLSWRGEDAGMLTLNVPGCHNISNALAALMAAMQLGQDLAAAAAALEAFTLPDRRFEILWEGEERVVVSDYAHHPTEIRTVVDAARRRWPGRRLVAVYQPHRFTRTRALLAGFAGCFGGLDHLVLAPVYAASEPELDGGTSRDLYRRMAGRTGFGIQLASDLEQAGECLQSELRPGDVLLVMGAGDVVRIAERAAELLQNH